MNSAELLSDGYARVLVAVDCSDPSNAATEQAVCLAKLWNSKITGLHAYAAKLHDHRFRQMEGGLPDRYRVEDELERQRDVHDDLITRGLRLITDSYLDQTERVCADAGLAFQRLGLEGRNYRVVLDELRTGGYDLLVLGSQGLGAVQPGLIGTVCERVVRRTTADTLVVKSAERGLGAGPILVALDGSHQSFGGLLTALELGRRFGVPVHAIAVYDPYFHYVAFNRIAEVLSYEAGQVFRFEEQEKLHEEIIDSGLAKIYQAHLRIAESIASEAGVPLETTLLDGKPYDAILKHVAKLEASLLVLGKVGIHAADDLDIGGNTQHLLRLADCNLLISVRGHEPAVETLAQETTSWTREAEARMERVPDFVGKMARMAILRYAHERGHTVITASIVEQATAELMPGHAHRAMQQIVTASDEGRLDGRTKAGLALPWSDEGRALLDRVGDATLRSNLELRAEKSARRAGAARVATEHVQGVLPTGSAALGELGWTEDAAARLERVPEGFLRDASRERIEGAVRIEEESLVAELPDGPLRLPLISAPKELSDWLDEGRRAMYEQLTDGSGPVRFFAQHLPMVVSYNAESVFPFTCGNKGVGYLPRTEHLDGLIARYRDTIEECKGKPWQDSLRRRVQAAADFSLDPERIDRRCLVTLEIFERQTFRNLQRMPLASLLFTGQSPNFMSFQVNCAVEIIGPGDPRYTFITLARTMFEYDEFHITQHAFPYGYVFWITECISKTPFRVPRGSSGAPANTGYRRTLPWDEEAVESVGRAPSMIQAHIQEMVERYARMRGFERISLTVVQEARENLMDGR